MKIYVIHASSFPDYKENLYKKLRDSLLSRDNEIIFPHEKSEQPIKSREIIANSDLIIAEVSYPSTGLGIELGWADAAERKILCIYKAGSKPSSSLKEVTEDFIEYTSQDDMVLKVNKWIEEYAQNIRRRSALSTS